MSAVIEEKEKLSWHSTQYPVAYLLLTIGFLAAARPLVIAGGWVAVACGLFSWIAAIASILGSETRRAFFRLPLGERIAAIE